MATMYSGSLRLGSQWKKQQTCTQISLERYIYIEVSSPSCILNLLSQHRKIKQKEKYILGLINIKQVVKVFIIANLKIFVTLIIFFYRFISQCHQKPLQQGIRVKLGAFIFSMHQINILFIILYSILYYIPTNLWVLNFWLTSCWDYQYISGISTAVENRLFQDRIPEVKY